MSFTPATTGEKMSWATDRIPEVTSWVPLRSSKVMRVIETRTSTTTVISVRRDRRDDCATLEPEVVRSA